MDPAADLFVGREGDPDRAVLEARVGEQMTRHRHHDGDTSFVVRPQQCRAAGRNNVVPDFRRQIWELPWR
jgi:hypothetical protein